MIKKLKFRIFFVYVIILSLKLIKCKENESETNNSKPTPAETYGYGTLAILLVSGLAWLGIILLPCFNQRIYFRILKVLAALAVGTLLSDAMMHMIPEVLDPSDSVASDVVHVPQYIYNIIVIMASIYLFWIFETILRHLSKNQVSHHGHSHGLSPESIESNKDLNNNDENNVKSTPLKRKERILMRLKKCFCDYRNLKKIKATGWMILAGDALHNFADGIAIGASFANSISMGLSTTIAVVVHEIPHELGNYAVLVNSGFDHLQALFFNFLSALSCWIGFYIGASLGSYEEASLWIFSITAGMFIYIALVDLLPSVIDETEWSWIMFIICNIAILVGWTIMFLLVIYEPFITV